MRRFLIAGAVLPLMLAAAACDDTTGIGEALIARDSALVIAVPTAGTSFGSAIDFVALSTRFPERLEDAAQWDFTLRQEAGALRLVPNPFLTPAQSPLIARSNTAFAQIERAPTARSAYGDSALALQTGATYVVRSRHYSLGGVQCFNFSKFLVKALDPAAGTATLQVAANLGCGDDRVEPD